MAHASEQHRPGAIIAGRFELGSLIAEGGMGSVYEAWNIATGVRGALKLMQPKFAAHPIAVERFAREAILASRIANPYIVKVLDAGRLDSGEPYLFIELLQGESLRARLDRSGPLAVHEALELTRQAAQGLIAAHEAGIVHRDVKPENLFLLAGRSPSLKVLDFGISKFLGSGLEALTKQGLPMGTFLYMPPEQMAGADRVDERADIYSLGVVCYESLAGRPPFSASAVPALMLLMQQQKYEPISQRRPELSKALDGLFARCLAADPGRRYPSMKELEQALADVAKQREQAP